MKRIFVVLFLISILNSSFSQQRENQSNVKILYNKIDSIQKINQKLDYNYNSLAAEYQHTNDRLNNYLTYTAIIASIFGILIALAGIYIGFESLRSQNRRKDAIKTLEDAKGYVNNKKTEFDILIESNKALMQEEYNNLIKIIKSKLLSDIEFETSKVREIAELKTEEIQKLSVEKQNDKTIELLEKRLEFFENVGIPDDPEILFSKAKILIEKKMHSEAIMLLEKIVAKIPEHKEAYWHLGYEYAELKETDNSIKNYSKQLELNPNDSSALNNIALRYKEKGNLLEALDCLTKAIEITDKKELYYTNRIDILKKLNSTERVISDYSKLITINPDKLSYYNEIIKALKNEKRNDEVVIFYDKVINHLKNTDEETSNDYSFYKAVFLKNISKEEQAIEILQNLIDNNYKIESCYVEIADIKRKLGKVSEAISILDNGITKNPLSSKLYIYKAFVQSSENDIQAKLTIDKGAEAINNENYYFAGGRFFNQKKNFALSEYYYEGALRLIESKLKKEDIEEGDIMNYYETSIILQKSLKQFDSKYREQIVSEKYQIILKVLDLLNELYIKFNEDEKNRTIIELKKLNIEAKDKDLITWNFDDIYHFIHSRKNSELSEFVEKLKSIYKKKLNLRKFNGLLFKNNNQNNFGRSLAGYLSSRCWYKVL